MKTTQQNYKPLSMANLTKPSDKEKKVKEKKSLLMILLDIVLYICPSGLLLLIAKLSKKGNHKNEKKI